MRCVPLGLFIAEKFSWSVRTFGMGRRTRGICEHIRKELAEIEANPLDREEWIDVMMLAVDGYCRAGGDPHQLFFDMQAKHAKNLARVWPAKASQDEPIEHVRAADEPGQGGAA